MRARAARHLLARVLAVLVATLLCSLGAPSMPAMAADDPNYSKVGPPDPIPKDFQKNSGGYQIGLDQKNHYCYVDPVRDQRLCRTANPGEIPGVGTGGDICEGADGTGAAECDAEGQKEFELKALKKWQEANKANQKLENYPKLNAALTKCVNEGGVFKACRNKWEQEFPLNPTLSDWVAGKISKFASDALQEAARYIGEGVVWLLNEFANLFNKTSTIKLDQTGIGKPLGITMAISAMVAAFLMLIQFSKTAISQRGELAGTAVAGLAKWAVISSVYLLFTQQALLIADKLSEWMITFSFGSEGGAAEAMQRKLGTLFAALASGGGGAAVGGTMVATGEALAPAAVGVVIVVGVITIVAIAALWVEMLMRQAGIMILLVAMPITLTGEISDSSKNWWPTARNALISLVLMKPVIVLIFTIGLFAMGDSTGIQNVIVGVVIFLTACFSWPVLAKFITFTSNGAGTSMMSGLMSSIGSSASARSGGPQGDGAGSVGGGSGYTKALEREGGSDGGGGGSVLGSAGTKGFAGAMSVATVGLQLAAVGKDALESGMANTAANAGLDNGQPGGRHAVVAQRTGEGIRARREAPEPLPEYPEHGVKVLSAKIPKEHELPPVGRRAVPPPQPAPPLSAPSGTDPSPES
ncbi:hypothetical protein Slala03_75730 [Streptomyces lavendulae subsp. lavendulae]|nr:hypothetical protein Slala03_75730 [Streptomyces lavendulae subsp. lavendulae]